MYICRCVRRTCPLVFLCRALVASTVSTPVSRTRFRCRLCLCCVAAPVSGSAMAAAMGEAIRAVLQPLAMAEHEVDEAVAALLAEAELIGSVSDVHDAIGFLLPPTHDLASLRSVCGALLEALERARPVTSRRPRAHEP